MKTDFIEISVLASCWMQFSKTLKFTSIEVLEITFVYDTIVHFCTWDCVFIQTHTCAATSTLPFRDTVTQLR